MSDEQDKLKLSLEPPKLFGRKKKSDAMGTSKRTSPAPADRRPAPDSAAPADDEVVEEALAEEIVGEPVAEEPAVEDPVAEEPATTVIEPVEEPVVEAAPEPAAPEPAPEPAPAVDPEPQAPAVAPQKAARAKPAAKTSAAPRPAVAKVTQPAAKPARPRAKLAPDIEPEPLTATAQEDAEILAVDAEPLLPFYPAAALTGAVVGVAMVVLTWLSLQGCEAVRDSNTCTGGPGFLLLVATFVLSILLGSTLLKTFSIQDPGSSSFLAVGIVAVVALLFLIDVLGHWSMLIVIPIIGVGGFLASVWVTKTFVEPGETDVEP